MTSRKDLYSHKPPYRLATGWLAYVQSMQGRLYAAAGCFLYRMGYDDCSAACGSGASEVPKPLCSELDILNH